MKKYEIKWTIPNFMDFLFSFKLPSMQYLYNKIVSICTHLTNIICPHIVCCTFKTIALLRIFLFFLEIARWELFLFVGGDSVYEDRTEEIFSNILFLIASVLVHLCVLIIVSFVIYSFVGNKYSRRSNKIYNTLKFLCKMSFAVYVVLISITAGGYMFRLIYLSLGVPWNSMVVQPSGKGFSNHVFYGLVTVLWNGLLIRTIIHTGEKFRKYQDSQLKITPLDKKVR